MRRKECYSVKIWIFNNYNMLPSQGGLNRHYFFAQELQKMGHAPAVFVGSHPHNTSLQMIAGKEKFRLEPSTPFPWVYVKTKNYEGSRLKRVLSMFQYYRNAKKAALDMAEKSGEPEAVLGSSAHPLAAALAICLGKKFGCRAIVEVRDLWPESIVAMGIAGPKNPAVVALRCLEKWIYKRADAVIFTMEGGYDYIVERGWDREIPRDKVFHINNGVDLETFQYNREHFHLDDSDLKDETTFKVIYTGSIRLANGVSQLIDCAQYLRNERDIKFLVYGKGEDADKLKQICGEKNLDNLLLKGYVEKKYIPYILSKSDLNLLNYFAAAAAGLYRFGSSQNKMFDYLASGKPVLANTRTNYDIVEKYHCGVCKQLVNGEDYAKEILKIKNLPKEEYAELCQNTQKAARDYDFKVLTQRLLQVVKGDGNDAIH